MGQNKTIDKSNLIFHPLQRNATLKHFLFRNSYLLVAAAWLITISFIIDNYWAGDLSIGVVKKNIQASINKQERDFDQLLADTSFTNKIASNNYDKSFLLQLTEKKYFLFVYAKNGSIYDLRLWNTQIVVPDSNLLQSCDSSGFAQLPNGYYAWRKSNTAGVVSIALIPVKWNYSIPNEYLQNRFAFDKSIDNSYDISDQGNNDAIKSIDGNVLFYLAKNATNAIAHNNLVAVVLRLLAAFLIFLFVHITCFYIAQKNFLKGTVILIGAVATLRVLSYFFSIPLNFRQFELFDPAIYGSNSILRSLGDLLINSALFLWVVLFIRYFIQEKNIALNISHPTIKWVVVFTGTASLVVSTLICGHILVSMVADSQISFDVVNFFTLNAYSVLGFIVIGSIAIGYFFFTQIITSLLQPILPKGRILLLLVSITGLAILTFRIAYPSVIFELYLLVWLLLYLVLLDSNYITLFVSRIASANLVFWLLFFSVSITVVIIVENNKREMGNRLRYAETLAAKADPSSERLMNTVLTDFRNETLAPLFPEFEDAASNKALKDRLINKNFSWYLNKYDTRIYTFDESEQPLFNQDSATFNTLSDILRTQGHPTAVNDLYYYDISYNRYSYISRKRITDPANKLLGYVFILATPKEYKADALYPKLFLKGFNNSIENSSVYSYAVYNKLKLMSHAAATSK